MKTEKETLTIDESILSSIVKNGGDVSQLTDEERFEYYKLMCARVGLDATSMPFKYLLLNGKWVIYLDRSGAQQLNKLHNVSHQIVSRENTGEYYIVTARASLPDGRFTESIGAAPLGNMKGDAYTNRLMFVETKSKRRATLDLLGLGFLDETEVDSIPNVKKLPTPLPVEADHSIKNPFKRKYELCAEVSDALRKTKELKELASLYYVNAEIIEANADLKKEFTERKIKFYNEQVAPPQEEMDFEKPVNDQDEINRTIDGLKKDIYLQRNLKLVNIYFNTSVPEKYKRHPEIIKAWNDKKNKLKEEETKIKSEEIAAHV